MVNNKGGNKAGTGNSGAAKQQGNVHPSGKTYGQVTAKREGGKK